MRNKLVVVALLILTLGVADLRAQQTSRRYSVGDVSNNEITDTVDFDLNAPILTEGDGRLYYIHTTVIVYF